MNNIHYIHQCLSSAALQVTSALGVFLAHHASDGNAISNTMPNAYSCGSLCMCTTVEFLNIVYESMSVLKTHSITEMKGRTRALNAQTDFWTFEETLSSKGLCDCRRIVSLAPCSHIPTYTVIKFPNFMTILLIVETSCLYEWKHCVALGKWLFKIFCEFYVITLI